MRLPHKAAYGFSNESVRGLALEGLLKLFIGTPLLVSQDVR